MKKTYKDIDGKRVPVFSLQLPELPSRERWKGYIEEGDEARNFKTIWSEVEKDALGGSKAALVKRVEESGQKARVFINRSSKSEKYTLLRFNGETVEGEEIAPIKDPRSRLKTPQTRSEFKSLVFKVCCFFCLSRPGLTTAQDDQYSVGPKPSTTILVFGFPELLPTIKIRQHFQQYGHILSVDRELDRATGAQLGIVSIKYKAHEDARKAVEKEKGKNFASSAGFQSGYVLSIVNSKGGGMATGTEKDAVKVILEREGKLLKLLLQLREDHKKEKERAKLAPKNNLNLSAETQRPTSRGSNTNTPSDHSREARPQPHFGDPNHSGLRNELSVRPLDAPKHPRAYDARRPNTSIRAQPMRPRDDYHYDRDRGRDYHHYYRPTNRNVTRRLARSPSRTPPVSPKRAESKWDSWSHEEKERRHKWVMGELLKNSVSRAYVFIDIRSIGYCDEEEIRALFKDNMPLANVGDHWWTTGSLTNFQM